MGHISCIRSAGMPLKQNQHCRCSSGPSPNSNPSGYEASASLPPSAQASPLVIGHALWPCPLAMPSGGPAPPALSQVHWQARDLRQQPLSRLLAARHPPPPPTPTPKAVPEPRPNPAHEPIPMLSPQCSAPCLAPVAHPGCNLHALYSALQWAI